MQRHFNESWIKLFKRFHEPTNDIDSDKLKKSRVELKKKVWQKLNLKISELKLMLILLLVTVCESKYTKCATLSHI